MHNYKHLQVWELSMSLAEQVYQLSVNLPASEKYGLTSQIRRSAISIASNIAEGSGRGSDKDFSRFLNIALGSSFELETQLLLANRLGLLSFTTELDMVNQVQKMVYSLIKRLENQS